MKLMILSDLHLETSAFTLSVPPQVDAILLAGDICASGNDHRLRELLHQTGGKPTFITPGNHEFYGADVEHRMYELRALVAAFSQVHLLQNERVELDGYTIHGATLWTDFNLYGTKWPSARAAERSITDFRAIRAGGRRITPADMAGRHAVALAELEQTLGSAKKDPKRRVIVMTHFVPHPASIHPRYSGDDCNPYFCTDLTRLFGGPVTAWIHGHTHCSFRYEVNGTTVVCNPRGYGRENAQFDPQLVLELP